MKTICIAALVVLSASGCASMEREKQANLARNYAAVVRADCEKALARPSIDPVRDLIAMDPARATLAQLSSGERANSAQQTAISAMDTALQTCREMTSAGLREFEGDESAQAYDTYVQGGKVALASLWAGNSTFGQYNTARVSLASTYESKLAAIRGENSRRQAAADDARRRAALQYMQNNAAIQQAQSNQLYQQQLQQIQVPRINMPTVTTCNPSFGGSTTCTTR